MKRCLIVALALMGTVAATSSLEAKQEKELGAEYIVERALEHNSFGFENALARMRLVITTRRGTERVREIEIRSLSKEGQDKSLVRFHSPADVAGTGFLVLGNEGRDDDQYLYLPALGKVKRITGSQKNQRFMGTDLTYADLESRNLKESVSKRLPDQKVGGNSTYVIESLPRNAQDSNYGKTISHIHTKSFVPLKVEFFDRKMRLLKVLSVKKLERRSGKWLVMDSVVKNIQKKTQTRMEVQQIDLDIKLEDKEFTQQALQEG